MKEKGIGMTLIEVLTVIAIISILTSIGVYGFRSMFARSRDSTRKSDLRRLQNALNQYYNDYRSFPVVDFYLEGGKLTNRFSVLAEHQLERKNCVSPNPKPAGDLRSYIKIPSDPKMKKSAGDNCGASPANRYLYISAPNSIKKNDPVFEYPATEFGLLATLEASKEQGNFAPPFTSTSFGPAYQYYEHAMAVNSNYLLTKNKEYYIITNPEP